MLPTESLGSNECRQRDKHRISISRICLQCGWRYCPTSDVSPALRQSLPAHFTELASSTALFKAWNSGLLAVHTNGRTLPSASETPTNHRPSRSAASLSWSTFPLTSHHRPSLRICRVDVPLHKVCHILERRDRSGVGRHIGGVRKPAHPLRLQNTPRRCHPRRGVAFGQCRFGGVGDEYRAAVDVQVQLFKIGVGHFDELGMHPTRDGRQRVLERRAGREDGLQHHAQLRGVAIAVAAVRDRHPGPDQRDRVGKLPQSRFREVVRRSGQAKPPRADLRHERVEFDRTDEARPLSVGVDDRRCRQGDRPLISAR